MGVLRTCGLCLALAVALVSIFLGALFGGHLAPLAPALSALAPEGNQATIGLLPSMLGEQPWHFEYAQLPDLTGKVALVTGANSGVGYWTALHLARQGAAVHVGCRSVTKCQAAIQSIKSNFSSAEVYPAIGDMSSLKSVRALGESLMKSTKRLDILVLNAGIAVHPNKVTEDNIEPVFATNHVGHQFLYTLLEELLIQTGEEHGDARVVAVSSAAHFDSYADGVALNRADLNARHAMLFSENQEASGSKEKGLYGMAAKSYEQSKLANVLFAQEAALRLRRSNVLVNSCHPGIVATEFMGNVKNSAHKGLLESSQILLTAWFAETWPQVFWTSEDGALTQVYLAASDEIRERNVRGRYFHPQALEVVPHRKHCSNLTLQKGLWKFTEELIHGSGP